MCDFVSGNCEKTYLWFQADYTGRSFDCPTYMATSVESRSGGSYRQRENTIIFTFNLIYTITDILSTVFSITGNDRFASGKDDRLRWSNSNMRDWLS